MNRYIAALLVLASLVLPVRTVFAAPAAGEGYARPSFPELVQTLVLLNGADISNPKIADEYGRLVYCTLYRKNFSNDVAWDKLRNEMITRALKKKEYFRVKYEVVGIFYLDRYDFNKQFFPISDRTAIANVGTVNLLSSSDGSVDCYGNGVYSPMFPTNAVMQLNEPLTISGFKFPIDKVEKMMVRLGEAGNKDRRVYGRIRLIVTDAKGIDVSANNQSEIVLNGRVISVDFFIDRELTKPIASVQINKE